MDELTYRFLHEEAPKKCQEFFNALCDRFSETHEYLGSCNQDISTYLIPKGTADQVSYSSKPYHSFRISDHWNWYSNIKKNPNSKYVQCLCVDLPYAKPRKYEGGPSKPIFAPQVAMIGKDGKYHCIFGSKFNKQTKTWEWIEANPSDISFDY